MILNVVVFAVKPPAEIECIFDSEDLQYPQEEQGFLAIMPERSIV